MNYIKKMIIQIEDSDGKVWENEIDGLLVKSIDIDYPIRQVDPWVHRNFRYREYERGPLQITIKMEAYGNAWSGVRPQSEKVVKQLPEPQKKLPEHG